jgi:hypothetical protein
LPTNNPSWTESPPFAYDIVSCWYPENDPLNPGPKLRPALVLAVFQGKTTGSFACRVAYGTRELKIIHRRTLDLIVQRAVDIRQFGLKSATRFDLDCVAVLPWMPRFFDCWDGYSSPQIGSLNEEYIREYAFLMMKRLSV